MAGACSPCVCAPNPLACCCLLLSADGVIEEKEAGDLADAVARRRQVCVA